MRLLLREKEPRSSSLQLTHRERRRRRLPLRLPREDLGHRGALAPTGPSLLAAAGSTHFLGGLFPRPSPEGFPVVLGPFGGLGAALPPLLPPLPLLPAPLLPLPPPLPLLIAASWGRLLPRQPGRSRMRSTINPGRLSSSANSARPRSASATESVDTQDVPSPSLPPGVTGSLTTDWRPSRRGTTRSYRLLGLTWSRQRRAPSTVAG